MSLPPGESHGQVSIDNIPPPVPPTVGTADQKASRELEHFELSQKADLQIKEAHLEGLRQDTEERKKYASRIFWTVAGWVVLTGIAVVLRGLSGTKVFGWTISFQIPNNVLIAMVGGTAASLVGLLLTVAKYLFQPRG